MASTSHGCQKVSTLRLLYELVLQPECRAVIACHYEIGLSFFGADDSLPSITDVMAWDTDPLRLRIDTQVPESTEPMRRWWSMGDSEAHPAREGRLQRRYAAHPARLPRRPATFLPRVRPSSSLSIVNCDGWCGYNPFACRVAVSLLSFSFSCRVGELTIRVF